MAALVRVGGRTARRAFAFGSRGRGGMLLARGEHWRRPRRLRALAGSSIGAGALRAPRHRTSPRRQLPSPRTRRRSMTTRAPEAGLDERLSTRSARLHISIGAVCNNNCIFCMEEDRDARYVNNSAMTAERVRWVLEEHRGAEEVCFTSGEPTTRSELPEFVTWAKELGFRRISMMTNGRRAAHLAYVAALTRRGLNRLYVSIHGHEARLHEGLTRTPGSFTQTVEGLGNAAKLKRYGLELHTSTVLTRRNLPYLLEIYGFLRGLGVDQ